MVNLLEVEELISRPLFIFWDVVLPFLPLPPLITFLICLSLDVLKNFRYAITCERRWCFFLLLLWSFFGPSYPLIQLELVDECQPGEEEWVRLRGDVLPQSSRLYCLMKLFVSLCWRLSIQILTFCQYFLLEHVQCLLFLCIEHLILLVLSFLFNFGPGIFHFDVLRRTWRRVRWQRLIGRWL